MSPTPKRAAVQAAVLRATEDLLADGASWSDLGVERIATAAGISRTAFYFYFRDKRELLMRLTEDVSELLYIEADRWFSADGDAEDELRSVLEQVSQIYAEHGALLRIIVEASTYDEQVAAFWRSVVERFVLAARTRIEAEQQAGRVPDFPAGPTAFALAWMTERTLYELTVGEPPLGREAVVGALAHVWLRAIYG